MRNTLGVVLMRADRAQEAEAVYRADPRGSGKIVEATAVGERFLEPWAKANIALPST